MTSPTDRITEVLTGFRVDPSPAVCGCYELTPEDARAVAEQVAAELQLTEELGAMFTDRWEGTNHSGVVPGRRWASAWSAVEEKP